jgi:streptomycin 6-kinase
VTSRHSGSVVYGEQVVWSPAAGVELPVSFLAFAARGASWADWLAALPRLIRDVLAEWSLTVDGPPRTGQGAVAIPVVTI